MPRLRSPHAPAAPGIAAGALLLSLAFLAPIGARAARADGTGAGTEISSGAADAAGSERAEACRLLLKALPPAPPERGQLRRGFDVSAFLAARVRFRAELPRAGERLSVEEKEALIESAAERAGYPVFAEVPLTRFRKLRPGALRRADLYQVLVEGLPGERFRRDLFRLAAVREIESLRLAEELLERRVAEDAIDALVAAGALEPESAADAVGRIRRGLRPWLATGGRIAAQALSLAYLRAPWPIAGDWRPGQVVPVPEAELREGARRPWLRIAAVSDRAAQVARKALAAWTAVGLLVFTGTHAAEIPGWVRNGPGIVSNLPAWAQTVRSAGDLSPERVRAAIEGAYDIERTVRQQLEEWERSLEEPPSAEERARKESQIRDQERRGVYHLPAPAPDGRPEPAGSELD